MTRFLLDTTFIVDVLNDRRERAALLESLVEQRHFLACCAVNVAEVYAGCTPLRRGRRSNCCASSTTSHPLAGGAPCREIKQEWKSKGKTFTLMDTTIAAVCITESLTLVTDNGSTFPCRNSPLSTAVEETR